MDITLSNTEIKVLTNAKSYVHKIISAWRLNMVFRTVEEEDTNQEIASFSIVPKKKGCDGSYHNLDLYVKGT